MSLCILYQSRFTSIIISELTLSLSTHPLRRTALLLSWLPHSLLSSLSVSSSGTWTRDDAVRLNSQLLFDAAILLSLLD